MNQQANIRDGEQTDLAGLLSRFQRHIPLSAAIIAACMVLAIIVTQFMPKKFTATADMNYAPQVSLIKGANDPGMTDAQRDAALEAQLQTVMSLPVAAEVIKKAKLASDPELKEAAASFSTVENPDEALAAALLRKASARRIGQTTLFRIGYTASDPLTAARIANLFADAYLENQVTQKLAQVSASAGQLEKRVEVLRQEAAKSTKAVAQFRVEHGLTSDPTAGTQDQQIAAIGSELANARSMAAQASVRSQAGGSAVSGSLAGANTTTISELEQQQASLSGDLAKLQERYGDRHPDVIAAQSQIKSIQGQVDRERSQIAAATRVEANAASARAASLAGSLAGAKGSQVANVRDSAALAELQRKADADDQLYKSLLETRGEQTAQTALVQPDARKVAPASPPLQASSPNLLINLIVGMAIGLGLALAVAFLRERWTQTLNTIDDIERRLGVNFLNSVPTLASAVTDPKTKDPIEGILLHPMSAFTESYRNLAATAMLSPRKHAEGGRVIGITSALPREGKTTTSIALARVIAMGGAKVALVDADLRRRSTTVALVPDASTGWSDIGTDAASLNAIAIPDESGMVLIPVGPGAHKTQRAFEGAKFAELIETLRGQYDVVVVDTAPVLAVVDTRTMLHNFDNLVLLAAWRQTPIKAIRAAIHQVESVGGEIDGVAMTLVNLKTQAKSGYGDASYYYRDMKEYYVND